MALNETNTLHLQDKLRQLASVLDAARHGEKSQIKTEFADTHNYEHENAAPKT